jgi:HK97 family phage portal protein
VSLIRSMIDGFSQLRAEVGGAPAPWDDFWYGPVGPASATGMRITPESAKRIAAVLACVGKIAKIIGMLPLHTYIEQSDGGKKPASWHPLYDLLYLTPNSQQTAFEFRQMLQGHLELRGNAYAEILPGKRGPIDQLIPLHPDRVQPIVMKSGRIVYRYDDPIVGEQRFLNQESVFHLRNFMDDGVVGQSTVSMGVDVFGLALAAQDYYARFLRNDARPGVVITGYTAKTNQDREEFIAHWQKNQTGANRHKVAVLGPNMDIKTVGVSSTDAQLLEARKLSRIEIASLFDIPPHSIGETEKASTFASVEQFNIQLVTYCILPRVILWEQAIKRALFTSPKYFAKFSLTSLLRGDNASRASFYQTMIQNGVFSQNEVRIEEDKNPIADGDNYWRPLNWARLGDRHTSVQDGTATAPKPSEKSFIDPRFKALACANAERCVRKESAAIAKLNERSASEAELVAFYQDHAEFLEQVLRISRPEAWIYCAGRITGRYSSEEEQVKLLTDLAVGGILQ